MILDEFLIKLGVISDTKKLDEFKAGLGAIASTATAVVGVVGGLTAGITAFFGSALSGLDDLANLGKDTGTSLEYIQKLGYAASVSGSSVEAANSSIKGLAQTIGEAASGMGRGEATFKKLGISAKNADGSVRSVNDVMAEVSDRMHGMSRSEQLNLLSKLGIDQSMIGLLSSTSGEMAELFNEAEALGLITADGADAAQGYNDALTQMQHVMGAVRTNIAIGLAPQLTRLMSGMKDWLIQNKELVQNGINKLVEWVLAIGKAILNFISAISKVIESTIGWKNALLTLVTILAYVKRATIAAFAANPVFWIVAAIAGLILLVDDLFTFLNGGESAFDWSWALPIIEKFKPIIERLSESFGKLFDVMIKIGGKAFAFLSEWWNKYGDNVINYIGHMIDAFASFVSYISNVFSMWVSLLTGDWDGFVKHLNSAFQDGVNFFKSIFSALWQHTKAIFGLIGVDIDRIVSFFKSAGNKIKSAWNATIGFIKSIFNSTVNFITDIWNGFENAISVSLNFISNLFDVIMSAISNIFNAVIALFTGDWDGFVKHLNSALDDILKYFDTVFSAVWQLIKGFLDLIGVDTDGFVAAFQTALNTVKTAWDNVTGALKTAWDKTMGVVMAGVDKVKNALNWIGEKLGITSNEIDEVNTKANQIGNNEAFNSAISQGISVATSASAMTAKNAVPSMNSSSTANTKNEYNNNAQVSTTINIQSNNADEAAKKINDVVDRQNKQATANYGSPFKQ